MGLHHAYRPDLGVSAADMLWIYELTGVRCIFGCQNPGRLALRDMRARRPAGVRPKIHFSSPRSEMPS